MAAVAVAGQAPRVLEIDGELRVPSVILVDGGRIVVGRVADEMSGARAADVLRTPKSRLGDQAPVVLAGRTFQVVPLIGALLQGIYRDAVRQMGSAPDSVRLTHPATWTRTRQAKLLDAATFAGFPATTLVSEPVAAALSYWNRGELPVNGHVAVYDLGGGTFDSAVLRASGDGFTIVGRPDGDPSIGGELFDELVVNLIGAELDPQAWEHIQLAEESSWRQVGEVLRKEARRAKETLSNYSYADVLVPLPTGLTTVRVHRETFEAAVAPYIADSIELLRRCIAEAGLSLRDVNAIQLVGGSSRIPAIEAAVRSEFPGVNVHRRGDPKNTVALGALVASHESTTPTPVGYGSSEERQIGPAQPPPQAGDMSRPPVGPNPTPRVPAAATANPVTVFAPPTAPAPGPPASSGVARIQTRRRLLVGTLVTFALIIGIGVVATRGDSSDDPTSSSADSTDISDDGVDASSDTSTETSAAETIAGVPGNTLGAVVSLPTTPATASAESTTTAAQVALTGGMKISLDLRADAVWEDGTPITYRDLACTWRANLSTPGSLFGEGYDLITSVEPGASDKQVVIEFSEPYAAYRTLFAAIIKKSAVGNCDDISADFQATLPMSGRQWQIESWNDQQLTLVPNTSYWGSEPATVGRLVIQNTSFDDVDAMLAGDVDFIYPSVYAGVLDVLTVPNVAAELVDTDGIEAMYLHVGASSPFRDPEFRRGFVQSIDADALFDQIYRSLGVESGRHRCGPVLPGPYCPADAFANEIDLVAAAATLSAAGYVKNSDGMWAKDGVVPTIRWLVPTGNRRREDAQTYLIPLLAAAGFNVVADNCDATCVFQQRLPSGDFELAMYTTIAGIDAHFLAAGFGCAGLDGDANNYQGENYQRWCNTTASAALDSADITIDQAARESLVRQAIGQADLDNIMISLVRFPRVAAHRTDRVSGVDAELDNVRAFSDTFRWIDVDGDGQIVIGAEQWPDCLNPVTDCANSIWQAWTVTNSVLPAIWDSTNEGGYVVTELIDGEPLVQLV